MGRLGVDGRCISLVFLLMDTPGGGGTHTRGRIHKTGDFDILCKVWPSRSIVVVLVVVYSQTESHSFTYIPIFVRSSRLDMPNGCFCVMSWGYGSQWCNQSKCGPWPDEGDPPPIPCGD